jgi:two-component system LytT family response regulator
MNICIIDDEKDNREILAFIINTYHKDVNIIGEADSVQNGLLLINSSKPDLIFLDIDLPDGTGFDIIRNCMIINLKSYFVRLTINLP